MAKDDGITAFLGAGTIYNGHLTFTGSVHIDGQFTGEIKSEGTLILGKDAKVEGNIQVSQLRLSGHLNGDVVVTDKTILHKTASLTGNLATKSLTMEEGALLQGTICMDPAHLEMKGDKALSKGVGKADLRDVDIQ